jgi:DNA-binding NtrC family response regulator
VVVLSDEGMVQPTHLPVHIRQAVAIEPAPPAAPAVSAVTQPTDPPRPAPPPPEQPDVRLNHTAREARRKAIMGALEASGGNRSLAAERLGISRSALYYQMKQLGIE